MNKETGPQGTIVLRIGVTSVIIAALYAIGSLGYYGLGYSGQTSALDNLKSGAWSEGIKNKIQSCFMYLFFSFYICIAAACMVFGDEQFFKIFSSTPMLLVDFLVQTIMQNGKALSNFKSDGIFSTQKLVWVLYCMFVGAMASPLFLPGIQSAKVATHLTGLVMACLTLYSFVLPVGALIPWKKGLGICEIIVFIASLGGTLFPISCTLGAILFTITFYGGLILYPTNFLLHSQEAQIEASQDANNDSFCSVCMSIPMLLDVISTFGRIVILIPPCD